MGSLIEPAKKINQKNELITEKTALAAFIKQYKGIFGKCGEYGHHIRDCPQNKPNGFRYCGEKGHYMRDCKVKEKMN